MENAVFAWFITVFVVFEQNSTLASSTSYSTPSVTIAIDNSSYSTPLNDTTTLANASYSTQISIFTQDFKKKMNFFYGLSIFLESTYENTTSTTTVAYSILNIVEIDNFTSVPVYTNTSTF